jgi:hypothetical protein
MKLVLISLSLLLALLTCCSGSKPDADDLNLEIVSHQVNSWVNLMPGSKPSFFISGSLNIKNNGNIPIDSIHLLKCVVLQEGNKLYELHPDLRSAVNSTDPLVPGSDRLFTLYLPTGKPILKELNFEKPVTVSLYLTSVNKMKLFNIDSIYVLKTY